MQPICFKWVTKARKTSTYVAPCTLRKNRQIGEYRTTVSGGREGANKQLVDKLKATEAQVRADILKDAGITLIFSGRGFSHES